MFADGIPRETEYYNTFFPHLHLPLLAPSPHCTDSLYESFCVFVVIIASLATITTRVTCVHCLVFPQSVSLSSYGESRAGNTA